MRRTLYLKFLLAYLIFGFFGYVAVGSFVSSMTREQLQREKIDALYREAVLVANSYAADLYTNKASLDSVKQQLDALDTFLDATLWIVNPSGRIILDSSSPVDIENTSIVEGFDPTMNDGEIYMVGDFFGYFQDETLSVYAPITSNYSVNGYVVIHYPTKNIIKSADNLLNISYTLWVIILLLSMIILIFFTELVYVPLRRIIRAAENYADGNMHYQIPVESDDELGYLSAALSYMSERIARSEDSQKKFIANVSHDFRSPLTSIKGYLQAMLDGTIPLEMHEKYISLVLNETERLTKLTNGLLQLNSLGTGDTQLNITDFDINKVIRNTVASFEGTCMGKEIAVNLILTDDQFYVRGDMERLQQVLYNLMDNAIKFSPANTTITIETVEKKEKLYVSVKDQGIGIPQESLSLIWSRFYKTDKSRGKDKKGTGLGLSIVREIMKAHGENIDVISTEGEGSEFVFSIPAADNDND